MRVHMTWHMEGQADSQLEVLEANLRTDDDAETGASHDSFAFGM